MWTPIHVSLEQVYVDAGGPGSRIPSRQFPSPLAPRAPVPRQI